MKSNPNCIFCNIIAGKIPSERVLESNSFIAIYDIKPKNPGHLLVIPKKHMVTLLDMPNTLGQELLTFTKEAAGFLLEKKYGDGFNVVMNNLAVAGQEVMHAHLHVIPRKEGDGLRFFTRI
jgi:histidine triad (HIT) family protein